MGLNRMNRLELWISTNSRVKIFIALWNELTLASVPYINLASSNWANLDRFSIDFFSLDLIIIKFLNHWGTKNELDPKWTFLWIENLSMHLRYNVLTKEISDFLYDSLYESSLTPRKFFQRNEFHSTFNHDAYRDRGWKNLLEHLEAPETRSPASWSGGELEFWLEWAGSFKLFIKYRDDTLWQMERNVIVPSEYVSQCNYIGGSRLSDQ